MYRSQFETRISNGGLTACAGGDRDAWEQSLFGGAYQAPGVLPTERPKYGGLNLLNHLNGACPRRLAERVAAEQGSAPRLDATNIGQAAVSAVREPARWRDWGHPDEVLVHLKDLWLMLVAHREPLC